MLAFVKRFTGLITEHDVAEAVAELGDWVSVDPADLIRRCRESGTVEAVAIALRVNLAALNAALEALGPPYGLEEGLR